MTLEQLIAAEGRAVDNVCTVHGLPEAKRKRLYADMRLFSAQAQRQSLPNDVDVSEAMLQLNLRAADLAGVSAPGGFYAPAERIAA